MSELSVLSDKIKILIEIIGDSGVSINIHEFAMMFSGDQQLRVNDESSSSSTSSYSSSSSNSSSSSTFYMTSSSSSSYSSPSSSSSSSSSSSTEHVSGSCRVTGFTGGWAYLNGLYSPSGPDTWLKGGDAYISYGSPYGSPIWYIVTDNGPCSPLPTYLAGPVYATGNPNGTYDTSNQPCEGTIYGTVILYV